jgi:hypothetical protein
LLAKQVNSANPLAIDDPRFLIEGKRGAIMHTGDIRAEPAMVSRLAQNAHIKPYLSAGGQQKKQLEAVYLDTSSFIGTQLVPSKVYGHSLLHFGYFSWNTVGQCCPGTFRYDRSVS